MIRQREPEEERKLAHLEVVLLCALELKDVCALEVLDRQESCVKRNADLVEDATRRRQ